MSTTKIVIIVLVLIGLLFIIFVARGALRNEPPPPQKKELEPAAKKTKPPDWTKTIKGLFSSKQPRLQLEQDSYSAYKEENIKPDAKQPFRTVTFRWVSGHAKISYDDHTATSNTPLSEMKHPQVCLLPQDPDPDIADLKSCSILALKLGGKLTFSCLDNKACQVKVE